MRFIRTSAPTTLPGAVIRRGPGQSQSGSRRGSVANTVTLPGPTIPGTSPTSYSWSGWFWNETAPAQITSTTPFAVGNSCGFAWDNTSLAFVGAVFHQDLSTAYQSFRIVSPIKPATWVHIGAVWDGSFLYAYKDGRLEGSIAANGIAAFTQVLRLFSNSGPVQYFGGGISKFGFWNGAILSAGEMLQLGQGLNPAQTRADKLLWHMDLAADQTAPFDKVNRKTYPLGGATPFISSPTLDFKPELWIPGAAAAPAATVTPPKPYVVDAPAARAAALNPVQAVVEHGFLGNTPANGVLPLQPEVVENDDRRRKTPPLQPIVINGFYATITPPTVVPPKPQFVAEPIRNKALNPEQPQAEHGFLGNVPPNGVLPPPVQNVDRQDQRNRFLPLDPVVLDGIMASFTAQPTVVPPGPYVVPLDERRRLLAAMQPTVSRGFDDPSPPLPEIIENERKRTLPEPPVTISGILAGLQPVVVPPRPQAVENELKRALPLPPVTLGGILAGLVPVVIVPPRPVYAPAEDRFRKIGAVPQPIFMVGRDIPFIPPVTVTGFYDSPAPVGAGYSDDLVDGSYKSTDPRQV